MNLTSGSPNAVLIRCELTYPDEWSWLGRFAVDTLWKSLRALATWGDE